MNKIKITRINPNRYDEENFITLKSYKVLTYLRQQRYGRSKSIVNKAYKTSATNLGSLGVIFNLFKK